MNNLIISLFNVRKEDIEKMNSINEGDNLIVNIRLKPSKNLVCPVCGHNLTGNGFKVKPVNHKILTDRNVKLLYEARRYRCKHCDYSTFEKNPFAINGFNNSIPVMDRVLRDLRDPRLNYTMIAQRNNISVSQVVRYFDSFVVIPGIPLPENLGIDEIHSNMARRKNASYLGVLTDNDRFQLVDILASRSKYDLNSYLSFKSKEERERVRYVTIDMWKPYKEMALKWFPECIVAVDPFHVIEHLTMDFTRVRIRRLFSS